MLSFFTNEEFLKIFVSTFIIFNITLNLFPILSMTAGMTKSQRRRTAHKGMLIAMLSIFIITLIGEFTLSFLDITVPAMQFVGGSLLIYTSLLIITGREDSLKTSDADISFFPIATPLLAGPAVFSYVIATLHECPDFNARINTVAAIFCALLVSHFILAIGIEFGNILHKNFVRLAGIVFGLFLMAMGVQILMNAINGAFLNIDSNNFTQEIPSNTEVIVETANKN